MKTSKAGKDDIISGEVVYPILDEDLKSVTDNGLKHFQKHNDTKQIRIDGVGYKLSENQIRKWVEFYGVIQGDLREEAVVDEEDGASMGTGAYLAVVRLR
jgi:hypothetical protein